MFFAAHTIPKVAPMCGLRPIIYCATRASYRGKIGSICDAVCVCTNRVSTWHVARSYVSVGGTELDICQEMPLMAATKSNAHRSRVWVGYTMYLACIRTSGIGFAFGSWQNVKSVVVVAGSFYTVSRTLSLSHL